MTNAAPPAVSSTTLCRRLFRSGLTAVALACLFGIAGTHLGAQAGSNPLRFFQNYFVTGDFVVNGVGLYNTGGAGHIKVEGVPPGSDILAAFLYWQVVADWSAPTAGSVGAMFRGHPLSSAGEPFGKSLGPGTFACQLSGGTAAKRTFGYRADVLRYFDVDDTTGKQAVNGPHAVTIPNNAHVRPLGASLVVVYRDPDPSAPLKAVVLYDGEYSMNASTGGLSQVIGGFYDGTPGPARLAAIVGSAQPLLSERLRFNNALLATNALRSSAGRQWDNLVFNVATPEPPARGNTSEVTVSGDYQGIWLKDCLSWAAAVYSTRVEDTDGDGLLDAWEESTTPLADPNGVALPNLNAMGASPVQRDLFIEIGYMQTADTSYGGVPASAHSHLPGHEALKRVGDAFDRQGIRVHFDVGDSYPPGDADPYVIRGEGLARGGEAIDESVTVCTRLPGEPPWVCQFSDYPGTVGWKSGYRFLRDEVLSISPAPPDPLPPGVEADDYCDVPGYTCLRRFDPSRHDMFYYSLFAHQLGLPRSEFPCLSATGEPAPGDANGACTGAPAGVGVTENPEFRIPRTNTGIGDFPGGDSLITLGGFADVDGLPIGTPFMQASTLMHELGHNFERRHGGEAFEPNCKPTYLSVMNYLYQLRGLLDDDGRQHLDFSGAVGATVNESALLPHAAGPYRLGWYAPLETSYLAGRTTPAGRHCNGSPLTSGELSMVRIDARRAADNVDWDADGNTATAATSQDVNYSGGAPEILAGSDDWSHLRLNQVASRRNVGAIYELSGPNLFGVGPLSIGMGKGDLGKGDLGKGDLGKGDLGKGDLGKGDLGKGDLGGGDLLLGDPSNPEGGEIDATTAGDLANTPPNQFTACVVGEEGCADAPGPADGDFHDVRATFTPPTVGGVTSYTLYRVPGAELVPGQTWESVGSLTAPEGAEVYTLIDTSASTLPNGAQYTFFVVATYTDGTRSDPSNLVTLSAVNDPLVAADDGYTTDEDTPLVVAAPGVLGNDDDPDGDDALTAALVAGPQHAQAFTLNADGSFSYTPAANFNGSDSFTYTANGGGAVSNVATVTITVSAVNDAPTISPIADRTIDWNTSTGPIPFTIGDIDGLTGLTVSGTSSNAALVPDASIVFGGSGSSRTVTVTPAAGQHGSATIMVVVSDGAASAQSSFLLTVNRLQYTFVALGNLPPSPTRSGSTTSMKWRYQDGSTVVNSSSLSHTVTVCRVVAGGCQLVDTLTNTDSGGSSFRYVNGTWLFTLQTRDRSGVPYPPGDYQVSIVPGNPAYQSGGPYPLQITP